MKEICTKVSINITIDVEYMYEMFKRYIIAYIDDGGYRQDDLTIDKLTQDFDDDFWDYFVNFPDYNGDVDISKEDKDIIINVVRELITIDIPEFISHLQENYDDNDNA